MKKFKKILLNLFVLFSVTSFTHAQGAGIEWEILNQEVSDLYRRGNYDRAIVVAKKALQVAEQNVGPGPS